MPMENMPQPTIIVIIGITGDLSRRYLLPAIETIVAAGAAPKDLIVLGVTRRKVSSQEVIAGLKNGGDHTFLREHLQMCQMDLAQKKDYAVLEQHLQTIEAGFGSAAQRLFYMSVPPQVSQPVVELLGTSGLAAHPYTKLLLEKPFGTDLASAQELVTQTKTHFQEDQVYRIDHYLAKEMAQNLIVFRSSNSLFKRTWNKDFIERIDILSSEHIGIEGRSSFYEQTGALRDVVQSHLLQLAALSLMKTPDVYHFEAVPHLRLEALKHLHADVPAVRGQYQNYRDEVHNPESEVETFASITLRSTDPTWQNVPIHISTGKALDKKATEIHITYKKDEQHEANKLVIRLQPNEGVGVKLWTKIPGYEWRVEQHDLDMTFRDIFTDLPEAYERVFLDAINSDHTLFTTSDEVLESWRILQPVQADWEMRSDDMRFYEPGSPIDKILL